MTQKAFISGCSGLALTADEAALFAEHSPIGLILFARNCHSKDQIRNLIGSFYEAVGTDDRFILVDQEGGRVARLKPPNWRAFPPASAYGELYQRNPEIALQAAALCARLMSEELIELGINVNCAPVLDFAVQGAHHIIGDRAFGADLTTISSLGRAVAESFLQSGILPVIKHIPGHGRATADSHESLPVINADIEELEVTDFKAFQLLNDMPLAMTAHVLIPSIDRNNPVSTSAAIISRVIRDFIGFNGVLMSDDLSMGALSGALGERTRSVIAAGCDIALHCNGLFEEMTSVAEESVYLEGQALERVEAAMVCVKPPLPFDMAYAEELLNQVQSLSG